MTKWLQWIGVGVCLSSMVAGLGGDTYRVAAPQLIIRSGPTLSGEFVGSVLRHEHIKGTSHRGWLKLDSGKGFVSTRFLRPALLTKSKVSQLTPSVRPEIPVVGRNITAERKFSVHLIAAILGYVGLVGSVWVLFGIEVRKQIVRRAKTPVAETPASEIPWWEEEQNVLPEGLPALDIGRNINVRLTTAREQDLAFSALELPPLVPEADGNTVPVLDLA